MRFWLFSKKHSWTQEQLNQECPGSGSLWEGKFRRTRCSTSNGLVRHLPGDYQTSLRYFAYCPECKTERAITKGKKLFVKHTRSPEYHYSHQHLERFARTLEDRRVSRSVQRPKPLDTRTTEADLLKYEEDAERRRAQSQKEWEANWKRHGAVIHKCGKPILKSVKGGEELEPIPGNLGVGRWYCTCDLAPHP
jgi:hypothetical protein